MTTSDIWGARLWCTRSSFNWTLQTNHKMCLSLSSPFFWRTICHLTIAIYFEDLKQLYKHIAVGRLGNDMKQFAMFFSEIRLGYISLDIYIYGWNCQFPPFFCWCNKSVEEVDRRPFPHSLAPPFWGKEIDFKKGMADALRKLAAAHLAKGHGSGGWGTSPGYRWRLTIFVWFCENMMPKPRNDRKL